MNNSSMIPRYGAVGSSLTEIKNAIDFLVEGGQGQHTLFAWDGDAERMMPVTGLLSGLQGGRVEIQTDSDECETE